MSRREILWGESWVNIWMMTLDCPKYRSPQGKGDGDGGAPLGDDELKEMANNI